MGRIINWARRGENKEHPLRRRILEWMLDGRLVSPNGLSKEFGEPLGNVAYHIKSLLEDGMIVLKATKQRRGAVEHFYQISEDAICYTHEDEPAESVQAGSPA